MRKNDGEQEGRRVLIGNNDAIKKRRWYSYEYHLDVFT
jgi:hypothetical protein